MRFSLRNQRAGEPTHTTHSLTAWPSSSTGLIALTGFKGKEALMTFQKEAHGDIKQAEKREAEGVSVDLWIHHHHVHPWITSLPSKQGEEKGR